ncbi:probable insulin-like peptide 1 [Lucilia cuprina]|uniref:probable insulin-like peptide 1 n=1 Tax=Lucilia cuprina TaxID=7375 RepID=UPI001F058876|nr:probable insulin-like peptide 1 [Lucilia cuprina]
MAAQTLALQRYCGKILADYMKMLCRDGFNAKPLKRNHLLANTNEFDYNSLANDIISLNMSDSSKSLQNPGSTAYSTYSMKISQTPKHALNRILSKLYNSWMLTQTQRSRQRRAPNPGGIYYECCLKGCATTEMIAYCLD